jgi:hypothetical protein
MRTDEEWLGIGIADDTNPFVPLHLVNVILEFGTELGVLYVVYEPGKALPV